MSVGATGSVTARRAVEDRWCASIAAAATLVLGLGLLALGALWTGAPPPAAGLAAGPAEGGSESAGVPGLSTPGPPMSLRIPAIGVEAPLTQLGLTADRAMEVPRGDVYDLPGWYRHGPRPGEVGPAVIGGHVDSRRGPSVFYRLGELRPGDEVEVGYADGTTARFEVDRVESHPKRRFPFDDVFGDTETAEVRLITCGGAFDRGARSYDDNLVAFATLTGADAD